MLVIVLKDPVDTKVMTSVLCSGRLESSDPESDPNIVLGWEKCYDIGVMGGSGYP